jgi:hypothetical protein
MKNVLLFIFVLIFSGGCSSKKEQQSEKKFESFILQGYLTGSSGKNLVWGKINASGFHPADTIFIGENEQFIKNMHFSANSFYAVKNDSGELIYFLPEKDTVRIESSYYNIHSGSLSGNKNSAAIWDLHKETQRFIKEVALLSEKREIPNSINYSEKKQDIYFRYDSLFSLFKHYSLNFILQNLESPVSLLALNNQPGFGIYVFEMKTDLELYEKVDSALYNFYPEFPAIKELHDKLHVFKMYTASKENRNHKTEK